MDFSQVKNISIPEGAVAEIKIGDTVVWSGDSITLKITSNTFSDTSYLVVRGAGDGQDTVISSTRARYYKFMLPFEKFEWRCYDGVEEQAIYTFNYSTADTSSYATLDSYSGTPGAVLDLTDKINKRLSYSEANRSYQFTKTKLLDYATTILMGGYTA